MRNSFAGIVSKALPNSGFLRRLAMTSVRVLRKDAARALPRPSASDSANVEKSTVSQSQNETSPVNQAGSLPAPVSDSTKVTSVMTLPTSTASMTGLRQRARGSSFFTDSSRAGRRIRTSKIEAGCGACFDMARPLPSS